MPFDVVRVGELAGEGPGGAVRKVRRALGVRVFGVNHFTFPPHHEGHEHDERETRHEEVFFCIGGSGVLRVDDEDVELRAGRFVRLDPEPRRCPVSGADGMSFLVIGAPVDGPYEPPPWG